MATKPSSPLAHARQAAGYTQERFAEELGVDRSTVGRWERGVQAPLPWQRPDIATALKITLDQLDSLLAKPAHGFDVPVVIEPLDHNARATQSMHPSGEEDERLDYNGDHERTGLTIVGEDAVHAAIPRLRRALDTIDLPDDGRTRLATDLTADVSQMTEHRVEARYGQLAWHLPNLISELARIRQSTAGDNAHHAEALLTLAFRAADGVAFKFAYFDLSARIIDLMRSSAQAVGDPLLLAAVAYVRTETFFATGDLDTASRLLIEAADGMSVGRDDPLTAAAYGALHMRAAVVAGRGGKTNTALDHLAEAHQAAQQVPDGLYLGTAFGPSSVRIHELAVAMELGGNPAMVQRAAAWHPPPHLPAERRSHYYIDLAQAQLDLGHHEDAHRCLETARQIAPQHTRQHPRVRRALAALLRTHPSANDRLLRLAAWARVR
jgi:transcriptional regulator with XRE-family HTH domain